MVEDRGRRNSRRIPPRRVRKGRSYRRVSGWALAYLPLSLFSDGYGLWVRRGFRSRRGNRRRWGRAVLEREIEQRIGIHAGAVEFDAPVEMRA